MKSLNSYLAHENKKVGLFGRVEMKLPLSQSDVDTLVDRLSAQLSPENLSCDGEIPMREVRARTKLYQGAYKDLGKYCVKNGLTIGELC